MRVGSFVISLDFELHWGVQDKRTIGEYRENLLGARKAIPEILALFRKYDIHATWAIVGFLFFETREQLLQSLPAVRPSYADSKLNTYALAHKVGEDEAADPYHFAPSLIRKIVVSPNQEIGTHTFSHFCCLEQGQTAAQFRADLEAAICAAKRFNVEIRSIVFPRNQVNYLEVCSELGIKYYRGTEDSLLYRAQNNRSATRIWTRAGRIADSYVSIAGSTCYSVARDGDLCNIASSRFLRPWSERLSWLDSLRLRRISSDMRRAAQLGLTFHLWWHPHNFGVNTQQNLDFLEAVLRQFSRLQKQFGMRSRTMAEAGNAETV